MLIHNLMSWLTEAISIQHVKREDGMSTAPRSLFDRSPALSKIRRTADPTRKSAAAAAAASAAFGQRPLPSPVVGLNTPSSLASLKHPLPRLQVKILSMLHAQIQNLSYRRPIQPRFDTRVHCIVFVIDGSLFSL